MQKRKEYKKSKAAAYNRSIVVGLPMMADTFNMKFSFQMPPVIYSII